MDHYLNGYMSSYQQVRIGNNLLRLCHLKSGVPQGSVLGPLLFLVFIGDLGLDLDPKMARILKYMDDSKIISDKEKEEDVDRNQWTLNTVYEWETAIT